MKIVFFGCMLVFTTSFCMTPVVAQSPVTAPPSAGTSAPDSFSGQLQIIASILAIPASILSMALAVNTFRKTTSEIRKIEAEARLAEIELAKISGNSPQSSLLVGPLISNIQGRSIQYILVRFTIFVTLLCLWTIVGMIFENTRMFLSTGVFYSVNGKYPTFQSNEAIPWYLIVPAIVTNLIGLEGT